MDEVDFSLATEDLRHVSVQTVEGKRKGLVATDPIKAGTVILTERPVVSFAAPVNKKFKCARRSCSTLLVSM